MAKGYWIGSSRNVVLEFAVIKRHWTDIIVNNISLLSIYALKMASQKVILSSSKATIRRKAPQPHLCSKTLHSWSHLATRLCLPSPCRSPTGAPRGRAATRRC